MNTLKPKPERLAKGLWWDRNWNIMNGCTKVSPGCDNCWAEKWVNRFQKSISSFSDIVNESGNWTGILKPGISVAGIPKITKEAFVWFVAERSDLFHKNVRMSFVHHVLLSLFEDIMQKHIFILLTKRPERFLEFKEYDESHGYGAFDTYLQRHGSVIPNLWAGVSVENQKYADERIPHLLKIPSAKHILSIEPMLGPVDLSSYIPEIDFVILGGESGPNARPMHPDWVRSVKDQCEEASVPFFFKQWGEYRACSWSYVYTCVKKDELPMSQFRGLKNNGEIKTFNDFDELFSFMYDELHHDWICTIREGKRKTGRLLDGKEYLQWPQ